MTTLSLFKPFTIESDFGTIAGTWFFWTNGIQVEVWLLANQMHKSRKYFTTQAQNEKYME
jgi:hypothetical protein